MSSATSTADQRRRSTADAVPAARVSRRPRDPRLLVGIALVVASMVLGSVVVARADRTTPVWSAARSLPTGTVLTADDLVTVPVRLGDATAAYAAGTQAPVGSRLVRDVADGELVPVSALTNERVGPRRLVTVPVEQFHAPAGLARGELVDVYVTSRTEAGKAGPSTLVAPRATVSAVEQTGGRFGSSARSVGVVLSLEPDLVARVVSGVRRGSVDLVRVPLDAR